MKFYRTKSGSEAKAKTYRSPGTSGIIVTLSVVFLLGLLIKVEV